jgi:hypothetical protein
MGMQGCNVEADPVVIQKPPNGTKSPAPTCRRPADSPVECSLEIQAGSYSDGQGWRHSDAMFMVRILEGDSVVLAILCRHGKARDRPGDPAPGSHPSTRCTQCDRIDIEKIAETAR